MPNIGLAIEAAITKSGSFVQMETAFAGSARTPITASISVLGGETTRSIAPGEIGKRVNAGRETTLIRSEHDRR